MAAHDEGRVTGGYITRHGGSPLPDASQSRAATARSGVDVLPSSTCGCQRRGHQALGGHSRLALLHSGTTPVCHSPYLQHEPVGQPGPDPFDAGRGLG